VSEEPRASARGFFQRKSQYDFKATSVQNYTAIPPRSSERGILAFSREDAMLAIYSHPLGSARSSGRDILAFDVKFRRNQG